MADISGAHLSSSARHCLSTLTGATTKQEASSPRARRMRRAAMAWDGLAEPHVVGQERLFVLQEGLNSLLLVRHQFTNPVQFLRHRDGQGQCQMSV